MREPRPDDPHGREAYWTELFGVRLERANLPALERALRQLLGELLPSGEPPRYLLRLPDRPPLPVFEEGGRLRLALGERRVEGADLSELRAAASAPATGPDAPAGGSPGGPWPHVLLFDRDLHGTDPVAVLRDGQVWLPVFAEAAGLLRTRAAGQRLDAAGDLDGMLALREQAARRLADAGKLHDPDDLAVTALAPETWARWSARLERVGELWVSLAVPPPTVHRSGRGYLAAVQDPDGTVALWCGRDRFDLTARVQRGMGRFILT